MALPEPAEVAEEQEDEHRDHRRGQSGFRSANRRGSCTGAV